MLDLDRLTKDQAIEVIDRIPGYSVDKTVNEKPAHRIIITVNRDCQFRPIYIEVKELISFTELIFHFIEDIQGQTANAARTELQLKFKALLNI